MVFLLLLEIAILATYWYINNPILYIYQSGKSGFSENYYQKIELKKDTNFKGNFAFKLISNFDVDGDNINGKKINYKNSLLLILWKTNLNITCKF